MKKIFFIIRLLIAAALIAALCFMCDLGTVMENLKKSRLDLLGCALLAFLASYLITAWRWKVLIAGTEKPIPFFKLIRYSFTASFCNNFLPTGFGGDITRIINMRPWGYSVAESTGLLFMERLIGFLTIGLLIILSLPFVITDVFWVVWAGDSKNRIAVLLVAVFLIAIISAMILLLILICSKKTVGKLKAWASKIRYPKVSAFICEFLEKLNQRVRGAKTIFKLTLVSILLQFSFALAFYLCFLAVLGEAIPFVYFFALVQITSLLGVVPISIETLGTREYVFMMFLFLDSSALFACLIIARAASVIMTLPGALFFITDGLFRKCTPKD